MRVIKAELKETSTLAEIVVRDNEIDVPILVYKDIKGKVEMAFLIKDEDDLSPLDIFTQDEVNLLYDVAYDEFNNLLKN
jgi:hypothetical protein